MTTLNPATATDWKNIDFRFRFAPHAQLPALRQYLDNAFSYEIDKPDDLFIDKGSRTSLHLSVIVIFTHQNSGSHRARIYFDSGHINDYTYLQ